MLFYCTYTKIRRIFIMNTLLGQQTQIASEVKDALLSNNPYMNHASYISGEMGVGKTYIASKIIKDLQTHESFAIVIAPKPVLEKWQSVLIGFGVLNVNIFNRKTEIPKTGVLIIQPRDLTPALDSLRQTEIQIIIYDEIHTLKMETMPFQNLDAIFQSNGHVQKPMFLGMTGTIFGQNKENLEAILGYTHPLIFANQNFYTTYEFMAYWTKIAWTLSLKTMQSEIGSDTGDDIIQEVAPIQLITPSAEQKLVYNIAKSQLRHSNFNNYEESAASILDLPDTSLIKTRNLKTTSYSNTAHQKVNYSMGFTVSELDFRKTPKYQKLLDILAKPEKTIIFANDTPLIRKLKETLSEDGYRVQTMPSATKAGKYSSIINDALSQDYDIFIIQPKKISMGVDINTASRIIWYQILSDLGDTIQAQRRIYRLSSTKSSIIHYLAYADTHQEKIIREISESCKKNAISYGSNDESNLAKLSGLLFDFNK